MSEETQNTPAEADNSHIVTTDAKRFLPVTLTDEDILLKAAVSSEKFNKMQSKKAELMRITSAYKEEKKELEAAILTAEEETAELSVAIAAGEELRSIDVEVTYDYKQGTVRVFRYDTDSVVEEREMYDSERQMPLPMEGEELQEDTAVQSEEEATNTEEV